MASEYSASSSSQQPFANPQPAPVPTGSSATSPPTKQSLKSWWKGFRPPTKNHETQGNSSSFDRPEPSSPVQQHFHASVNFVSKIAHNHGPAFQETVMNEAAPGADCLSPEGADQASSGWLRSKVCSSFRAVARTAGRLLDHKHSSDSLEDNSSPDQLRQETTDSVLCKTQPFYDGYRSSQNDTLTADNYSNSSENELSAGLLPSPHRFQFLPQFSTSAQFKCLLHDFRENTAKKLLELAEQPTGIFGVPLRQSITYANVAISLVDGEGKSYIYGYVPIVVAKCGVYLKEKGAC